MYPQTLDVIELVDDAAEIAVAVSIGVLERCLGIIGTHINERSEARMG